MSFNAEKLAQELLIAADRIEKEASEKTLFSCEGCNHTATLSSINTVRSEFAKKQAAELKVEVEARPVTVNDKIACPDCGSVMAYEPTAESERFYVESAEDSLADLDLDFGAEEDEKDKPKKEKKDKKDEEPATEEPAAEEPPKEPPKEEAPKEEPPKEAPAEEPPAEEPPKEEPKKEDTPEEDTPEEDIFEPVDEQADKQDQEKAEEEEKKKKAPKKEKKEDKEDKPTPKFEKMPKEASERFIQKLAKYSL